MSYFIIATSAGLTLLAFIGLMNFGVFAQSGSMSTLQDINASLCSKHSSWCCSKREHISLLSSDKLRFLPVLLLPGLIMTLEQPHTVTSGQPKAPDEGSVFNSGYNASNCKLVRFNSHLLQPGEFLYHCNIHPWRVASVQSK